mmetsp:Transcript_16969/g.23732  ORF Transcript_16969/g.23732 Transcript_16969/m.23732 type:complete len:214 (-) Transcript_16969:136-777(-)|eukprot:CAMPEP_0184490518 /NCGR_PEP_ID=MMETSP0113_2-20130426/18070_1 /TAXON_ID=91329 /ORGANISM="Norrisiella sphaerica, Strain BC52" /LENGTH=213 /DNA_ID=CAMNT_0026874429 /DNA_START=108 /DNA_END=749 /DNA_ORIENTATION=+
MTSNYAALSEEKDGNCLNIKLKEISGTEHNFSLEPDSTVGEFKKSIQAKLTHPVDRQRLIWRGRELLDSNAKIGTEFKGAGSDSVVVHLVVRSAAAASNRPAQPQQVHPQHRQTLPSSYQNRPLQTVKCPFCRIMVQFPVGSQMIRCSTCGGISRIQFAQERQKRCPKSGCNVTLAYRTNMQFVRCPKCVSTIETARWRVVQRGDAGDAKNNH